jgi:hypothetical protein
VTEPLAIHFARALAAAALLALLIVGCLALFTVVPLGWMWIGAQAGGEGGRAYLVALAGAPPTMMALGIGLQRVEIAYWLVRDERPTRSLLETMLVASAILALLAFVVSIFFVQPPATGPWST